MKKKSKHDSKFVFGLFIFFCWQGYIFPQYFKYKKIDGLLLIFIMELSKSFPITDPIMNNFY